MVKCDGHHIVRNLSPATIIFSLYKFGTSMPCTPKGGGKSYMYKIWGRSDLLALSGPRLRRDHHHLITAVP